MTDARFPERWLNDRRVLRLPDAAFRLFVLGLTWSVANRTDGLIALDDLVLIPGTDPTAAGHMEDAGLWLREAGHWLIADFEDTQTTRAQLEHLADQRRKNRDRQRRHRDRERDVPRDVTRDSDRTGQARPGQARTGSTTSSSVTNPSTNGEGVSCTDCGRPISAMQRAQSLKLGRPLCSRCAPHAYRRTGTGQ
jgi:hypothetical protein